MPHASKSYDETGLERLVFFTDAVMAIAITLLVLEIKVPELHGTAGGVTDGNLQQALLGQVQKIVGFAVSFVVIGTFWRGHHRMFRYVATYSPKLLSLSLYFLLFISFLPYPTALFSEYPALHTASVLYGLTLACAGILQWNLWRHVVSWNLLREEATPVVVRWTGRRLLILPAIALVATGASLLNMPSAGLIFATIPVWIGLGNRLTQRAIDRDTAKVQATSGSRISKPPRHQEHQGSPREPA